MSKDRIDGRILRMGRVDFMVPSLQNAVSNHLLVPISGEECQREQAGNQALGFWVDRMLGDEVTP